MAYKVMIVDDEPPFIRMLKRTIQGISTKYDMWTEAYNGKEALLKIENEKPDIIFTDVRMPVMDGIDLIQEIKSKYDDIIIVIVSGFKEFEYAKRALQLGVKDYLLKPIDEEVLRKLLHKIEASLIDQHKWVETQIINRAIKGITVDHMEHFEKRYNDGIYYSMILKEGFFSQTEGLHDQELSLKIYEIKSVVKALIQPSNDYWVLGWQVKKEVLIIIKAKEVEHYYMEHKAKRIYDSLNNNHNSYITCFYSNQPTKITGIGSTFNTLRKHITRKVILGKNQLICLQTDKKSEIRKHQVMMTSEMEKRFSVLVKARQRENLKSELVHLFSQWEQGDYPIFIIKKTIKQLISLIEKNSNNHSVEISLDIEHQIDNIINLAKNYGEVLRGLLDIIDGMIHYEIINKKNVLALLVDIEDYITVHISEPLTLLRICDIYGISQPYLSGLFRKYKECSVNEYITRTRIELAMEHLKKHPDILVKEVATIVGYTDQHYFSRIFKKVAGESPSMFQNKYKIEYE